MHDAPVEEVEPQRHEIGEDEGPGRFRMQLGEDVGADHAANHSRDDDPKEQLPVDVAMRDVADAGNRRSEGFRGVDSGRCGRGRHADADQDRAGDDTESHPERTVHKLCREPDQGEDQQCGWVGEDLFEDRFLHLGSERLCPTRGLFASMAIWPKR